MTAATPMSHFAATILNNKRYTHEKSSGHRESWSEVAERVVKNVVLPYLPSQYHNHYIPKLIRAIEQRKFMPGGRYLYAAGRRYPQIANCFLFRAEDSKEGWGTVLSDSCRSLMSGGGVGVVYSPIRGRGVKIEGLGGECTGPISLMSAVNETGRHIRQGGSRRSALWAGLHWWHPDVFDFITIKDWDEDVRACKQKNFNFAAPMDGTNISVILDDDFFAAYHDPKHPKYNWACNVYWASIRQMLRTGEPGFSVDIGDNSGQNLRNAPIHGDTKVLTDKGYARAADLADEEAVVWTGKRWAEGVVFKKTGSMVPTVRVKMTGGKEIVCEPSHPFLVEIYEGAGKRRRLVGVERVPAKDLEEGDIISVSLPKPDASQFKVDGAAYTVGFLWGDGHFCSKRCADLSICAPDKEPCIPRFSALDHTRTVDGRGYTRLYFRANPLLEVVSKEVLPRWDSLEQVASFLAGLFDADGNVFLGQKRIRLSSSSKVILDQVARLLESLGILGNISHSGPSGYGGQDCWQLVIAQDYVIRFLEIIPTLRVRFDVGDYQAYRKSTTKVVSVTPDEASDVYCADVKVEEHCFQAEGVLISNCTEITSEDNRDMCNLGSLVKPRISSLEEFHELVELGTIFLLCGTLYGKLPIPEMYMVREKNRRIGLGLMGIHEWLLQRGKKYAPDSELERWLEVYAMSTMFANEWADRLSISRPVATRSIAPTGTISIIAETTSGIEPVLATAYKRRYLDGGTWKAQYVVDPAAQRMIDRGIDPSLIEDSYDLAADVPRRIGFQRWVQKYVDHGISSTINLPSWGTPLNNESTVTQFGNMLLEYLPGVRGITVYPDGARGGQPLNRVSYHVANQQRGKEFIEESEDGTGYAEEELGSCKSGVCGE